MATTKETNYSVAKSNLELAIKLFKDQGVISEKAGKTLQEIVALFIENIPTATDHLDKLYEMGYKGVEDVRLRTSTEAPREIRSISYGAYDIVLKRR